MPIWRVPVELTWPNNGGPGVNVFHVRTVDTAAGAGESQLQNAVDALRTFYSDMSGGATPTNGIFVTGMTASLGQVVNVEDQTTLTPAWASLNLTGSSSAAPQALQYAISWRTSIAARRGMGRTFIGPLNTANIQTDGTPATLQVQRVRDACTSLITKSTAGAGWSIGVYGLAAAGPGAGGEYEGLPRVLRDITSARVRDVFATLKSRRD